MTRRRRAKKLLRGQFWTLVILCSVFIAACALISISERLSKPFLPTWAEIFQTAGLSDAQPKDSELQVHMIDVGNADAILVRNKGQNLLIDAGENDDGMDVVAYLRNHGVKHLDYVIATHPDADHIGGMDDVVKSLDIGTFIMAFMPEGFTPTSKTYRNLLEALDDKALQVTEAKPGTSYALGDAVLDILGPATAFEETNNQSVVCKVTFGARKFLFMGDAETEAEDALLKAGTDLTADVLKVGHHGSSSSTQRKFLKQVNPRYALITCGTGNSYNHPHENTLQTLHKQGVTWYRSDLNGTVVVITDGSSLQFQTTKGAASE